MTLEAASEGAISMQDAEQRLLLEPTVAQHSLSLLRTKVLGVHPKDGSSPAVGWRAMSTDIYLQPAGTRDDAARVAAHGTTTAGL